MSKEHEQTIGKMLAGLKAKYLEKQKEDGGSASGFRDFIARNYSKEPMQFEKLTFEILMQAATKSWQDGPKRNNPDLFSINGIPIQENFTRTVARYVDGEDIENNHEESFQKVSYKYATLNDMKEDADITSRKAHQTAAAAEEKYKLLDEARRRAKGDMSKLLSDLADPQDHKIAA